MLATTLGILTLAGCAAGGPTGTTQRGAAADAAGSADTAVDAEARALLLLGFDGAEFTAAADPVSVASLGTVDPETGAVGTGPDATASREGAVRDRVRQRWQARHPLRQNGLHGEMTVMTANGPRTVVGQRGTVTAVDDSSITVESADGYTLTWTFGDPVIVIDRGVRATLAAIDVAATVGVTGTRDGPTARLIVLPKAA